MTIDHNRLPSMPEIKHKYKYYSCDNEVKWLWEADYYDGPIEGMVKVAGQMYWAFWIEEDDKKRRVFVMFDLGKTRTEYEEYWNELFELCVGSDCRYTKPESASWKFFYGRQKAH